MSGRSRAIGAVLGKWTLTDPQLATDAAKALPAGTIRNDAVLSIVSVLAQRDVAAAVALANEQLTGNFRLQSLRNTAQNLSYTNPKAAAEIALQCSLGDDRNYIIRNVLANWGRDSPADAIAFIQKNIPPGDEQGNAMQSAISAWVNIDPKNALEFAMSTAKSKPETIGGFVANWAQQDSAAAYAWASA
jgi:hypothetical protein